MIDDRHMEASYRDIAREEKRSSRIGLIEDIREAHYGKSITLWFYLMKGNVMVHKLLFAVV